MHLHIYTFLRLRYVISLITFTIFAKASHVTKDAKSKGYTTVMFNDAYYIILLITALSYII